MRNSWKILKALGKGVFDLLLPTPPPHTKCVNAGVHVVSGVIKRKASEKGDPYPSQNSQSKSEVALGGLVPEATAPHPHASRRVLTSH